VGTKVEKKQRRKRGEEEEKKRRTREEEEKKKRRRGGAQKHRAAAGQRRSHARGDRNLGLRRLTLAAHDTAWPWRRAAGTEGNTRERAEGRRKAEGQRGGA